MVWPRGKDCVQASYYAPEHIDIPKNPVFYPPTPKRDRAMGIVPEAPDATSRSRPGRLISRLKNIFVPSGGHAPGSEHISPASAPGSPPDSSSPRLGASRKNAKPRVLRRSRLVARSPLCENSISPDLRALADTGHLPSPARFKEYIASPHSLYSSTIFYTRSKRRPPNWNQFSDPVCTDKRSSMQLFDTASPGVSDDARRTQLRPSMPSAHSMLQMSHAPQGTVRPASVGTLSAYSLHSLSQLGEAAEECNPGYRASYGSGSTAGLKMEPCSKSVCLSDSQGDLSAELVDAGHSCSRSQRTLDEAACEQGGCFDILSDCIAGSPQCLDTMHSEELMLEVFNPSRRPYSDDFTRHTQLLRGGFGSPTSSGLCEMAMPCSQRAMYIRSSCDDSGLIKSTFDLVKLLPNAPN
ncbi:hypothetical protein GQ54DRAFT_307643 [Martensiomyces pterosporus]|nr:hypothetical protein GQ54DRAFT_307643 [Martensiomyces pterosporus]